ncbi:MAG: hypothetical protein QHG98_07390 [Methanothrix sp.]|jgi:hypothetical protein|nr:hypothetical protein [Methanothrix sp.]
MSLEERWSEPAFTFTLYSPARTVGKRLRAARDVILRNGWLTEQQLDKLIEMYADEPDVTKVPETLRRILHDAEVEEFNRKYANKL